MKIILFTLSDPNMNRAYPPSVILQVPRSLYHSYSSTYCAEWSLLVHKLYPSEQGQCLISCRKTIIDQHEKEIHYLQDVFMAMEQNYIDSEYESKLEFQSMWDDLKNKVWRESTWARAGREGREKCSRPLEGLQTLNQLNQEYACTPTAFCNFVEISWEYYSKMSRKCTLELKGTKEIIWIHPVICR